MRLAKGIINLSITLFAISAISVISYKSIKLSRLIKEKEELKTYLDKTLNQKAILESRLAEANAGLQDAKDELKPLENEILNLETFLRDKEVQETALRRQLLKAQTDIPRLEGTIIKSREKIAQFEQAVKLVREENNTLKKKNQKLESELAAATNKLSRAQENISKLKNEISAAKKSNLPMEKRVDEFAKTIIFKDEEISRLSQELTALNRDLENTNYLNEQIAKDFNKQITGLGLSKESLKNELDEANTKLAALNDANNYLEKQIAQVEQQLEEAQGQKIQDSANASLLYNNLKEQLSGIANLLSRKEKELNVLEAELNMTKLQQKRTAEELNKVAVLNAALQQNLINLSQSIASEELISPQAEEIKNKVDVILMPQTQEAKE